MRDPDYDGLMGLSLVYGPAHAGKVALLLDRFVDALDRDPWLIVPNRVDVDRVERELAGRRGALLAGTVGTFDTLFAALAGADQSRRILGTRPGPCRATSRRRFHARCVRAVVPVRGIHRLARRCVDRGRGQSARSGSSRRRPRRSCTGVCAQSSAGSACPTAGWCVAARSRGSPPISARGTEHRYSRTASRTSTGAEWRLVEALAARGDVHVSLPYEPGRAGVRVVVANRR